MCLFYSTPYNHFYFFLRYALFLTLVLLLTLLQMSSSPPLCPPPPSLCWASLPLAIPALLSVSTCHRCMFLHASVSQHVSIAYSFSLLSSMYYLSVHLLMDICFFQAVFSLVLSSFLTHVVSVLSWRLWEASPQIPRTLSLFRASFSSLCPKKSRCLTFWNPRDFF